MNFLIRRFVTNHARFGDYISKTCLVSTTNGAAKRHSSKQCVQLLLGKENRFSINSRPLSCRFVYTNGIYSKNIQKILLKNDIYGAFSISLRTFQTTTRKQVPAIVLVILRPFGKVLAALLGRRLRNWWKNLPEDKRVVFREWLSRNKTRIALWLSSIIALLYVYYYTHLQDTPLTGRRRFVAFTDNQYSHISEMEYKQHLKLFSGQFLPKTHPVCKRIEHIAHQILEANKDLKQIYDKNWSVCVVDQPNVKNAFVLPTGQIFVFTGMFSVVSNDDQLGIVLAHEMSHAILGHGAELLSQAYFMDIFIISALCLLWALAPVDSSAAILSWLCHKIIQVTFNLPYNRMLETEADEIGLQLAAKACFDVREAVVFWKKMSLTEKNEIEAIFGDGNGDVPDMEFLSTHPRHEKRAEHLESLLQKALETRDACKCPRLPKVDPIIMFEKQKGKVADLFDKRNANVISLRLPKRPTDV